MITINTLDFVIIFIVGLYMIGGFRDGLLKQVVGLAGFVIAFFIALYSSRPLGASVARMMSAEEYFPGEESTEIIHEGIPWLGSVVNMESILGVLCFIALFIILQIVIGLVAKQLRFVNYIPVIGSVNILGGVLIGALKGLLFVFILITMLSLVPFDYLGNAVSASKIAQTFNMVFPDIIEKAKMFFLEYYYVIVK